MTAVANELSAAVREWRAARASKGNPSSFGSSRRVTEALAGDLACAGVDPADLLVEQRASESARYRLSSHMWDLVLISKGIPVAVIEWKALGSSHNYSNRLDELLAAAIGLRAPFAEADAASYGPQLACLFIADMLHAETVSGERLGAFAERLSRMVSDGLVECACILCFDPGSQSLTDFSEDLGFGQFAASVVASALGPRTGQADQADLSAEVGRLFAGGNARGFARGFASTPSGQVAAETAIIENRRNKIKELQDLAITEGTTELQMQAAIGSNYWIFGGQYTGLAPRNLVKLDQHDFALVCADGSLHIIELKRPDSNLVEKHRSHYIVSGGVHMAISQCLNYLRSLDEQGATMQTNWHNEQNLDIDFRRAKGTVVIGHLENGGTDGAAQFQVQQAIRSYNAHLARIQVTTYSELLDSADRALRFEINPENP